MSQSQEPSALKPCPFDGGKASLYWTDDNNPQAYFCCDSCGASTGSMKDKTGAIEVWNRRPAPSESEAVRAAYLDAAREAREPQVMILTHKDVADGILNDNHPVILARKQMREDIAKRLEAKAALPPSSGGEAKPEQVTPDCPTCRMMWDNCQCPAPAPKVDMGPCVIERLAAVEHERWSGWILHQLKVGITPERMNRWVKLANTPYSELTEELKEMDRAEVRKTLAALSSTPPTPPSSGGEAKQPPCQYCGEEVLTLKGFVAHRCPRKTAPAPSESGKCRRSETGWCWNHDKMCGGEAKHNSSGKLSDCADPKPSEVEEEALRYADAHISRRELLLAKGVTETAADPLPEYGALDAARALAAALRRAREELAEAKEDNRALNEKINQAFKVSPGNPIFVHPGDHCPHKARAEKAEAERDELKERSSEQTRDLCDTISWLKARVAELEKGER